MKCDIHFKTFHYTEHKENDFEATIDPDKNIYETRHENFHGKFSLCAEYLISSIGQKFTCNLKVFTDYSEVHN